jgi:hypothetical protein
MPAPMMVTDWLALEFMEEKGKLVCLIDYKI